MQSEVLHPVEFEVLGRSGKYPSGDDQPLIGQFEFGEFQFQEFDQEKNQSESEDRQEDQRKQVNAGIVPVGGRSFPVYAFCGKSGCCVSHGYKLQKTVYFPRKEEKIMYSAPRIEERATGQFIGICMSMSLMEDKTGQLWRQFMPRRHEIMHRTNTDVVSLQVYPKGYFLEFDPSRVFV